MYDSAAVGNVACCLCALDMSVTTLEYIIYVPAGQNINKSMLHLFTLFRERQFVHVVF